MAVCQSCYKVKASRFLLKDDRLATGNTLRQYERQYRRAFIDAVKAADPDWKIGKTIKSGVLDGITREAVEMQVEKLNGQAVDIKI